MVARVFGGGDTGKGGGGRGVIVTSFQSPMLISWALVVWRWVCCPPYVFSPTSGSLP